MPGSDRLTNLYQLRTARADRFRQRGVPDQPNNGDEDRYANKINTFTKTLLHNALGEVSNQAYQSMMKAINSGKSADFDAIIRGGNVRLKNPMAAFSWQSVGADQCQYAIPPAYRFDSAEQADEMVEMYWLALARDIPFAEYDTNELTNQACRDLSRFMAFKGPRAGTQVTPATLFRGNTAGDLVGPYVSQFLLKPASLGSQTLDQRQMSLLPGQEFMTDESSWLEIQFGIGKGAGVKLEDTARYIRNGRDLAAYVHLDYGYSPYYAPAWTMLHWGDAALGPDNPYIFSRSQDGFVTFGGPAALDFAAKAATAAFHAAWWQKWMVHRRARPEVFAGRIHYHTLTKASYPIHSDVLESNGLAMTQRRWGTEFLPQAYSEGSPAHSSYPSGHATVAGACITMLKAFFNENFVIPDPVVASPDGKQLLPWKGADLTIGNELNKLASNIAIARNFAGIHWRSDAWEGMKLGEQVAIDLLSDFVAGCAEDLGGFTFTKLDGTKITVGAS
jgi:membrane-associated phospholipid phosphatase